ncbi:MAG TPA: Fic family protein [Candidatus Gracilibacteria bacterium]|nr:Fic family protein [Candidatus Gracilibacteria bacterium]
MSLYHIPLLPLSPEIETSAILKKTIKANKVIAELKGMAQTIPNQSILINTLSLQESKDSSEIESIVTTHDELFRFDQNNLILSSPAAKEVHFYNKALYYGVQEIKKRPISNTLLVEIGKIISASVQSFRKMPGTKLINSINGEVVYTPPQNQEEIEKYMKNLEIFINDDSISPLDPLVKMAIIHHQFESIHPFHDGNGRTGRILNILYLISQGVLDIPILYLSRYITQNKAKYYELLQKVRDENNWEDWILFMLDALESTAKQSIQSIEEIKKLMVSYKKNLKEQTKFYSHELINNLFRHPYTKIEFVMQDVNLSRITAAKYLNILVEIGLLKKQKVGKTNYYINENLLKLFTNINYQK